MAHAAALGPTRLGALLARRPRRNDSRRRRTTRRRGNARSESISESVRERSIRDRVILANARRANRTLKYICPIHQRQKPRLQPAPVRHAEVNLAVGLAFLCFID